MWFHHFLTSAAAPDKSVHQFHPSAKKMKKFRELQNPKIIIPTIKTKVTMPMTMV